MTSKNSNITAREAGSRGTATAPGFETARSSVSRRDFFNIGLAGAALLALSGCATFQGSKNDLNQATTDLRNLLEGFDGDAARQARLASIGHRIENRCREVVELKSDFIRRMGNLSRRRETPSSELTALVEDFYASSDEERATLPRRCESSGPPAPCRSQRVLVDRAVLHNQAHGFDALIGARLALEHLRSGTEHGHILEGVAVDDDEIGVRARLDDAKLTGVGIVLAG